MKESLPVENVTSVKQLVFVLPESLSQPLDSGK